MASWIFAVDVHFEAKASRVLDLYQRIWGRERFAKDEFVIVLTKRSNVDARVRLHPTQASESGRDMRVEFENMGLGGALAYLVSWGAQRAMVFGICAQSTGIEPLGRLVLQVLNSEPYRSAKRAFWIVDNGSSHLGQKSVCRLQAQYKNLVLVHLPVHGSWLGQVAIYLSIVEREGLSSGDFSFLTAVTQRLFEFEEYYEQIARPFQWKFTRKDLHDLLTELDTATRLPLAAWTFRDTSPNFWPEALSGYPWPKKDFLSRRYHDNVALAFRKL